jgi:hypothetical protein
MEYLKELYACNMDDKHIWCKCPFTKLTHQFKNHTQTLMDSDMERFIEEQCECPCNKSVVVNVGYYTNRVSLQLNKKKTGYLVKKKSSRRLQLLHQLELEGRRQIRENRENVEFDPKKPLAIVFQ